MTHTAAPAPQSGDLRAILLWLGILALLAVAGGVAIFLLRRAVRREPVAPGGFTLADLKAMRDSGALSDQEFERARAAVIGRATAPDAPPAGANAPTRSR